MDFYPIVIVNVKPKKQAQQLCFAAVDRGRRLLFQTRFCLRNIEDIT